MFEYIMPCLHMRAFPHTLLTESLKSVVRIQQLYGRERGLPWGISEAAFSARDGEMNYQYQAFGIPEIAAKDIACEDVIVAPYATLLALMVDPAAATDNLRRMAAAGWTGTCGFYESVDHCLSAVPGRERTVLVRAFMAHHQGMGLLAIANVLLGGPMQERFHADPLVQATEYLLQERVPMLAHGEEERQPLSAGVAQAYLRWKAGAQAAAKLGAEAGGGQASVGAGL
jgi:hypothetical protein